jgi:hypothetical protein
MNLRPTATISTDHEGIHVVVTWEGAPLDRPSTGGFCLKPTHMALAKRLVKAIEAGVVYRTPSIERDVYGQTYVRAGCRVLGRRLNADLLRLGY